MNVEQFKQMVEEHLTFKIVKVSENYRALEVRFDGELLSVSSFSVEQYNPEYEEE